MTKATNLGFPRIGARRELKKALEGFWSGSVTEEGLRKAAADIRATNWTLQKESDLDHIPSNEFTYYDQVLDAVAMTGAVPERYNWQGGKVGLDTYFAMTRGNDKVGAMEMTKWFDTNYHYIVPEFHKEQTFSFACEKVLRHFEEAKKLGIHTRPVLIGPVSFLLLGKMKDGGDALTLLEAVLPVYEEVLERLAKAGADWVQMDEPCFVLDQPQAARDALKKAYDRLSQKDVKVMLATYFDELGDNMATVLDLPVAGVHLDLKRAPQQLEQALKTARKDMVLSLGVIDGRNIWRADLSSVLPVVQSAVQKHGSENIFLAPSCSLIHCPVDLDNETSLDDELKSWLAFSRQKLDEVVLLAKAAHGEKVSFEASDKAAASRKSSARIHNEAVKERAGKVTDDMLRRRDTYPARSETQHQALGLPLFPTTTIGSFPQTPDIREARAAFKSGKLPADAYDAAMKKEIEHCVRFQEEIGLDVLVHGEAERNDMVEYFGEQLEGYTFTKLGWVQSYGSRYVKPPIVFGDVSRPKPMTVYWSSYAQSLTEKPMKGMLTGPVTMLQWSFVRDDQPRSETAKQIALALRDEVTDLEQAGIKVIQIDEPAVREGLPLRQKNWQSYLRWAVDAFRLASSGVRDETQIHTHMCYAEFNDIIESVAELDADVISIETSRSQMELLDAFVSFKYPNEIGPGVYDIHSPRLVGQEEMENLLRKALKVLKPAQVWVNPDCGLKTRKWDEVSVCLKNMVAAARSLRTQMDKAA